MYTGILSCSDDADIKASLNNNNNDFTSILFKRYYVMLLGQVQAGFI